jgi:hypothetical protein
MTRLSKIGRVLPLLGLLAAFAAIAQAQVINSGARPISLNATLQEAVSVSLSANAVNFALTAASANNPGSTSITATTSWTLRPNRGALSLYAFFSTAASALTDGAGNNIPSSAFSISNNGGAFLPLVNTVPFGGANAGRLLSATPILGNNKSGSRTDLMLFNINLTGLPNLPSGTFTGILTIQAQAI